MRPSSFHLFPLLPLELRIMIYEAATQPRVVHVREFTECPERFVNRLATEIFPHGTKLDREALRYFEHIWKHRVHSMTNASRRGQNMFSKQTTLEEYHGFVFTDHTRSTAATVPANESSPFPSLLYLAENSLLAWHFLRKSILYSTAPIPALIHTSRESRGVLHDLGYRLAFGTRSSAEGLTWFNFTMDTLYLEDHRNTHIGSWWGEEGQSFMSGDVWEVGQFMPEDLVRVKKLALVDADRFPWQSMGMRNPGREELEIFARFLVLFPALEEIHGVEWIGSDFVINDEEKEARARLGFWKSGRWGSRSWVCYKNYCCEMCSDGKDADKDFYQHYTNKRGFSADGEDEDDNHSCCSDLDLPPQRRALSSFSARCSTTPTTTYARKPWHLIPRDPIDEHIHRYSEAPKFFPRYFDKMRPLFTTRCDRGVPYRDDDDATNSLNEDERYLTSDKFLVENQPYYMWMADEFGKKLRGQLEAVYKELDDDYINDENKQTTTNHDYVAAPGGCSIGSGSGSNSNPENSNITTTQSNNVVVDQAHSREEIDGVTSQRTRPRRPLKSSCGPKVLLSHILPEAKAANLELLRELVRKEEEDSGSPAHHRSLGGCACSDCRLRDAYTYGDPY